MAQMCVQLAYLGSVLAVFTILISIQTFRFWTHSDDDNQHEVLSLTMFLFALTLVGLAILAHPLSLLD
jgi:hypothetical protein